MAVYVRTGSLIAARREAGQKDPKKRAGTCKCLVSLLAPRSIHEEFVRCKLGEKNFVQLDALDMSRKVVTRFLYRPSERQATARLS